MTDTGKPPLDEAYLEHFGVKGMRWGVRNEDQSSGRPNGKATDNALAKSYLAALPKKKEQTREEAKAGFTKNQRKFFEKFEPSTAKKDAKASDAEKKGLSKEQKVAIGAAVGVGLVVAGLLAYKYYSPGTGGNNLHLKPYNADQLRGMAGKKISAEDFAKATRHSKDLTWAAGDFVQPNSLSRGEIRFPKGHTFHRLAGGTEESFFHSTYATHSKEDFDRYTSIFTQEKGMYSAGTVSKNLTHVTFSAKEEVRIPSTASALETMRNVLSKESGVEASREQAIRAYSEISGSHWGGPRGKAFTDALKSQGFHGVVDEMDAGVVGESPVVLFAHESFTNKVSKSLGWADVENANNSLIEIANRKLNDEGV